MIYMVLDLGMLINREDVEVIIWNAVIYQLECIIRVLEVTNGSRSLPGCKGQRNGGFAQWGENDAHTRRYGTKNAIWQSK